MLDNKRSDLDTLNTKVNSLRDHEAFEKSISQLQARLDELEIFHSIRQIILQNRQCWEKLGICAILY